MSGPEWPSTAYDAADIADAVLHHTPDGWVFAIAMSTTMIDGALELAADAPVERAQAALVERIERGLRRSIKVEWTRHRSKPNAWSADIAISLPDGPPAEWQLR